MKSHLSVATREGGASLMENADINALRDLAVRVADLASRPEEQSKIDRWKRLNALQPGRPMIFVQPDDSGWRPVTDEDLVCRDPLLRQIERQLRMSLYRGAHLHDDWPIEARVWVLLAHNDSGWGFQPKVVKPTDEYGAYHFEPVILAEKDFEKMRWPEISVDWEKTNREVAVVEEAVGDLLDVRVMGVYRAPGNPAGIFATMRGLSNVYLDMYDRPKWLHEVLEFMTQGYLQRAEQMQRLGVLTFQHDNAGFIIGSGGLGYTDELPAPDYSGGYARCRDVWGRADAQEFQNVRPEMYWEFSMQYQARILERFGLTVFACCEAMDGKYQYLKHIPNVRRVSVSPWADLKEAAESLEDRYVLSWKMNPADILGTFDANRIRTFLKQGLETTRGCRLEIILNNVHTVFGHPERLGQWVDIARETIEEEWRE